MNSIERLRKFVEEDLIYQAYKKKDNEPNKGFERQCFVHCRDIENVLDVLDEIREQLKKIKPDLDFEPWSIYEVSGGNLFDLLQILDKVKE